MYSFDFRTYECIVSLIFSYLVVGGYYQKWTFYRMLIFPVHLMKKRKEEKLKKMNTKDSAHACFAANDP